MDINGTHLERVSICILGDIGIRILTNNFLPLSHIKKQDDGSHLSGTYIRTRHLGIGNIGAAPELVNTSIISYF